MDDILTTYNLTKEFKSFCAVKNLNLHIKKGDIYGFLGQNGAGKTTTIRMIMGLIKPTSGEIELFSEKTSNKNRKVKEFSLGMKQRLGIARALLHHPEFLILDEPTNGLDPIGIKEIRELIIDLCKKQDITFLISSHILSEVQQMANKIGIIHKGELLEEISYDELQRRNRHYINIKVNNDKKASFVLEEKLGIKDYVIWGKIICGFMKGCRKFQI